MTEQRRYAAAFVEVVQFALRCGEKKLNEKPGCWSRDVDDNWRVTLNCHAEATKGEDGVEVPPYSCAVTWNGWPAGVLTPFGGIIVRTLGQPSEDRFIAALQAAPEESSCPKKT